MPELPDLERFKRYVDATSLHQRVAAVDVSDTRILDGLTPQTLGRYVNGKPFAATYRHGKFLFVHIGENGWLALHFGMTGDVEYRESGDPPKFTRVQWHFTNGGALSYLSRRMLGRVAYTKEPGQLIDREDLGIDAVSEELSRDTFVDLFSSVKGALKPALMKQERIAGIGNVWADEILFQAGYRPETKVDSLGAERLGELHRVMKRVLRTGARNRGKPDEVPGTYLLRRREEGAECPKCGNSIQKKTVSGRSTYWCSKCQTK